MIIIMWMLPSIVYLLKLINFNVKFHVAFSPSGKNTKAIHYFESPNTRGDEFK